MSPDVHGSLKPTASHLEHGSDGMTLTRLVGYVCTCVLYLYSMAHMGAKCEQIEFRLTAILSCSRQILEKQNEGFLKKIKSATVSLSEYSRYDVHSHCPPTALQARLFLIISVH